MIEWAGRFGGERGQEPPLAQTGRPASQKNIASRIQ
jgi:hypothetical protein